jgi:LysR family glycine cleavage system transcriptional activator
MDAIEDASTSLVAESTPQKLHINALPTFAERWLSPLLRDFAALHPRAQISISTSLEETDWDTDRADISIYASIGAWTERGERLFETSITPVCSPAWLAQHGKPAQASDLLGHALLSSINKSGDWLRWFHSAGLQPEAAAPQYLFGTSALAYKAAIDGMGVVCAEHSFVTEDIKAGRLVPLSDISAVGSSYFVEIRPDKKEGTLSRAFRAWIVAQAASHALKS